MDCEIYTVSADTIMKILNIAVKLNWSTLFGTVVVFNIITTKISGKLSFYNKVRSSDNGALRRVGKV